MSSNALAISSITAMILLVICILIYSQLHRRSPRLAAKLILTIGIIPGVAGVIYALVQTNTKETLALISVWLLLEIGAGQLRALLRSVEAEKASQD